jgi:hypothetical protein
MPGSKERPRRGVDMGHHYSFLGGKIIVGAHCDVEGPKKGCAAADHLQLIMQSTHDVLCNNTAGPDWKAFMASVLLVAAPAGARCMLRAFAVLAISLLLAALPVHVCWSEQYPLALMQASSWALWRPGWAGTSPG